MRQVGGEGGGERMGKREREEEKGEREERERRGLGPGAGTQSRAETLCSDWESMPSCWGEG